MKRAILLIFLVSSCDTTGEPSDIWAGSYVDSLYTYSIEPELEASYDYKGLVEIGEQFIAELKCDIEQSHIDCSGDFPDHNYHDIKIWNLDGKYTVQWGSEDHEALRKL